MGNIRKLPFILGCLAAIVTGIVSYSVGVVDQTIYLRMAVMMLLFYILGLYIRYTVRLTKKEVKIREVERQKEERIRKKQLEEEKRVATINERLKQVGKQEDSGYKVNLTANDAEDDFEPLTVSRAIRTGINE